MLIDGSEPKSIFSRRQALGILLAPIAASAGNLFIPSTTALVEAKPKAEPSPGQTAPMLAPAIQEVYFGVAPFKQLTDNSCARAAVNTALRFLYQDVLYDLTDPRIVKALPEQAHLVYDVVPSIAKLTNNKWGAGNYSWRPDTWFAFVHSELSRRRPVIALMPNGTYLGWNWDHAHYITIHGITNNGQTVHFADPWKDISNPVLRTFSKAAFETAWSQPANRYDEANPWQGVYLTSSR